MAAKKDFLVDAGSALDAFMTRPAQQPEQEAQPAQELQEQAEQPATYRKQDVKLETKSRRLQVLMYPSVYNELKTRANAAKNADGSSVSVNDYLNTILLELFKEGK